MLLMNSVSSALLLLSVQQVSIQMYRRWREAAMVLHFRLITLCSFDHQRPYPSHFFEPRAVSFVVDRRVDNPQTLILGMSL